MPTYNDTVKIWLKNALLQLGAESYLHNIDFSITSDVVDRLKFGFNDPTHSYIDRPGVTSNTPVLAAYNRMIETQAVELLQAYDIIDQHANDYIEVFYNRIRKHQTLGYVSPMQFEKLNGVA